MLETIVEQESMDLELSKGQLPIFKTYETMPQEYMQENIGGFPAAGYDPSGKVPKIYFNPQLTPEQKSDTEREDRQQVCFFQSLYVGGRSFWQEVNITAIEVEILEVKKATIYKPYLQ